MRTWAVIKRDDEHVLLEIESTLSRSRLEKHIINKHGNLELLMTRKQVERFQNLSLYEFAKKYGQKGWTFDLWQALKGVDLGGKERV